MGDASSRPVLLVDNNATDVELTKLAFAKNAIPNDIIVADDGAEAVDLLLPPDGREPLRPSIVLMDISMPRMSGLEALGVLRAHPSTKTLPVIMLSSSSEDRHLFDSSHLAANGYVQKPMDFDQFLVVAHQLGIDWLGLHR